jgi:hypothetical protein
MLDGQSMQGPSMNYAPLTDHERHLLRVVEGNVWTPELRVAIASAVMNRGFTVGPHDTPDQMAELLRLVGGA